jgi:hypothetical protein
LDTRWTNYDFHNYGSTSYYDYNDDYSDSTSAWYFCLQLRVCFQALLWALGGCPGRQIRLVSEDWENTL